MSKNQFTSKDPYPVTKTSESSATIASSFTNVTTAIVTPSIGMAIEVTINPMSLSICGLKDS